jgi:Flp pilus assembly protein TadB
VAQTKKKRRKKHKGTQGGRIDTKRRSRPRSREEAKAQARSRRSSGKSGTKADLPPTWRNSVNRGVIAAVIFGALLLTIFHRPLGASLGLAAFMLIFYIPGAYYLDSYMWRRRERARMRERERS